MVQRYKWKNIVPVFLLMVFFVILNLNTFTTWFRGDSELYYKGICESVENLKKGEISLANFGVALHMCYGYSLFVFLGQLLIPYYGIGVRLANLLMALVTIFIFWKIIERLFPKAEQWTRVFITAAFAFSPFMLGIFSEVHTDFPVLCFFIWLVYCYMTKRQKLCLLTGFLLCFSKETGVLYYAAFFAGCFFYRLVKNENKNWLKKIGSEFSVLEWMLLIPADLFLVSAAFSGGWANTAINPELTTAQVNTFQFSPEYIWVKFRELFFMNFSWLLAIPVVFFAVSFLRKKLQDTSVNREWMAGIGVSAVSFLLFNCSFYTFTHYRYLQLFLFFYLVLVLFLLEKACHSIWLKRGFCFFMAAAFLIESFVTVDPVTYLAFHKVELGNGKIVTTHEIEMFPPDMPPEEEAKEPDASKGALLDSIVYNREYLGFERAFEEAMEDIGYDGSTLLLLPAFYEQNASYTILSYFGSHDSRGLRWDAETNNVTLDKRGTNIIFAGISKEIASAVVTYPKIWYVKLCHQGEWYREHNLEHFEVLEERSYQSGKWKLILEKVRYKE